MKPMILLRNAAAVAAVFFALGQAQFATAEGGGFKVYEDNACADYYGALSVASLVSNPCTTTASSTASSTLAARLAGWRPRAGSWSLDAGSSPRSRILRRTG
ncbi:MAG: hypothetical protein OXL38_12855 [Gammaproteobacteria bacterium]|nr:hypothetical protein [Gammaproteobacteria bacterium]